VAATNAAANAKGFAAAGNFRAVGMAMEYGEGSNEHGGDPWRRLDGQRNHQSEDHSRRRDTDFIIGYRHACNAEHAAKRHDERKDGRQQPHGQRPPRNAPQRPTATIAAT
jgi:hypothetical protein